MPKIYRVGEFAKRIGKSPDTLRRWDREGRLSAKRTPAGHRYYDEADVRKALGIEPPETEKRTIVYLRVSSRSQLDDLNRQREAMEIFCLGAGIAVDEWMIEFGSGLNFKRPKFLALMDSIEAGQVSQLIVAHKDRLTRFGFDFFATFAQTHGCQVTVANQEELSPEQEMIEDLMAILHCFSCRFSGLSRYQKQIKEAMKKDDG